MSNQGCAAVLFAKDHLVLARFYREVAGLRDAGGDADGDEDHVTLVSGAFELFVQQIPERYAKHIVIATPPVVREMTPIKLCFSCADLSRARETAARLGGALYGPDREWRSDSAIVCDGYDPEGNVFQLFQPLTT
jgi:predicted enzyme related to lactoylglutathione lyase